MVGFDADRSIWNIVQFAKQHSRICRRPDRNKRCNQRNRQNTKKPLADLLKAFFISSFQTLEDQFRRHHHLHFATEF